MPAYGAIARDLAQTVAKESEPYIRSLEHGFNQTDEGKFVAKVMPRYRQKVDEIFAGLHTQAQAQVKANPGMQMPHSNQLENAARREARIRTFGSHDALITGAVTSLHMKGEHLSAENLMDHIAMYLHEDEAIDKTKDASRFKAHAVQEIQRVDPAYKNYAAAQIRARAIMKKNPGLTYEQAMKAADAPQKPHQYTIDSPYRKPSKREQQITSFVNNRAAPLIVIPHLGTLFNTVWSVPTRHLVTALVQTTNGASLAQLKQMHIATGLTAEGTLRGMRAMEAVRNGKLTKYLPGSIQDVMAKVTMTPGFNYARDWQVAFTGSAVYHSSVEYAARLAKNPNDKRAEYELTRYGMWENDIKAIKNTGKLTPDQMKRAVWEGTNKNVFLDPMMARSFKGTSNAWFRAVNMFHSYVASQAKFMLERIHTDLINPDTRSPESMAKAVVMLGAVFPVAGEALKMLEMVGRGQWAQINEEAQQDWDAITFAKQESFAAHARDFAFTYGEALAHLGMFGVAFGLIQGAQRGMLAQQMLGPVWGMGEKIFQDTVTPSYNLIEGKKSNWKPFMRDALEYGLPYGVGRFAKHAIPEVRTKREEELATGRKRRKRLPRIGSVAKIPRFNF